MKKKLSGHLLKISVSAFLLWILVASIGTSELQEALYSTKPSFILLALCINGCATLLGVYRWKILLAVQKIFVPFRTLLSISLVSGFFSAFLPSAFGGDVVRGYDMFKYSNKLAGVLASIMVERFFALVSLAGIGGLSLIIDTKGLRDNTLLLTAMVTMYSCIFLLFLGLLNTKTLSSLVPAVFNFAMLRSFKDALGKFNQSLDIYKVHTRVLLLVIMMSLLLQASGIIYYYVIALSISLQISFFAFVITIPLVWIVTMAPVSAGGMGVKEGMFVLLFSNLGVSPAHALVISLLGTVVFIPFALVGCIIYVTRKGF
jgi:hypothetical protein